MATSRISAQQPPHIDPTQAPVAFGNRALPSLCAALQDAQLHVRQRALVALCALVHDPERAYEAIHHGCLEILKSLLRDADASIRVKTTELLYLLATHNVGREAFLRFGVLAPLSDLLEEPVDACRRNTHRVLRTVAEFPAGAECLVSLGLVPQLVMKVAVESEEIRILVLESLCSCCRVDPLPALASGGVAALRGQLTHDSVEIRRPAADTMLAISVPAEGKLRVCDEALLPVLVSLLSDADAGVAGSAAGIIMNTVIITAGKYQALEAGALAALLALVGRAEVPVCVCALRALTALAEVPTARAQLLPHLPIIQTLLSDPTPILQRAAATAISVISWTP